MFRYVIVCVALLLAGVAGVARAEGLGPISELRLGLYGHDIGWDSDSFETVAGTGEVLFRRPPWQFHNPFVDFVLTPRPHIGGVVTGDSGANFGYAGLTWDLMIFGPVFAEIGLGGVIHDGETDGGKPNEKDLGSRVLFHQQISVGAAVTEAIRIMATFQHISNAGFVDSNPGLNVAGLRVGYKF